MVWIEPKNLRTRKASFFAFKMSVWDLSVAFILALPFICISFLLVYWMVERMNSARELLECPVCTEEMRPPTEIYQCINGHSFCGNCRHRVRKCPTCRVAIGPRTVGRNRLVEKIAEETFGPASEDEIRIHNITNDLWKSDSTMTEDALIRALSLVESGQMSPVLIKNKARQIKRDLESDDLEPSKASSLLTAASMIKLGVIKKIRVLDLYNIDLDSVDSEVMSFLVSVVKNSVTISFVTGNLNHILSSIRCRQLVLQLDTPVDPDTLMCLVEAMRTNVECLVLEPDTELDIVMLTQQYDGHGRCREVWASKEEFLDPLISWAQRVGWHYDGEFNFTRI